MFYFIYNIGGVVLRLSARDHNPCLQQVVSENDSPRYLAGNVVIQNSVYIVLLRYIYIILLEC